MKIIVSHLGKQHVNALLLGLAKKDVLQRFYTSIAANKWHWVKSFSQKVWQKLQKRHFDLRVDQIRQFPTIAALTSLTQSEFKNVRYAYRLFDFWVAQRLNREDFDMVIGYENANLLTFKRAKELGKITVLDLAAVHHNFQNEILFEVGAFTETTENDYINRRKERAFQYTDYVLTISTMAEKSLLDNGFDANRIFKVYLGINQRLFLPKKSYNTEGVLELYFVGTMGKRKAFDFIMRLFNRLLSEKMNVRLTLIGPVDDVQPPTKETPQYRYIPFLPQSELVKLHHSLDLFIFPSNMDSWAQVVVEAMACGSPVLVSNNTGAQDAVAQGGGFVLPINDEMAWFDAIQKFYNDRSLLKKLGEKAVLVSKQYTWEAYHDQVFEAMQTIYKREKVKIRKEATEQNVRETFKVSLT